MINRRMNKKILEGRLTWRKNFLVGEYQGYYITIDCKQRIYAVYIHATFNTFPGQAQLQSFLRTHVKRMPYLAEAEDRGHNIKLRIVKPTCKKMIPSILNEIIEPIIMKLLECRYDTGCISCGDNETKMDCYEICGNHYFVCEYCIRENQQEISMITKMFQDKYRQPFKKMKL